MVFSQSFKNKGATRKSPARHQQRASNFQRKSKPEPRSKNNSQKDHAKSAKMTGKRPLEADGQRQTNSRSTKRQRSLPSEEALRLSEKLKEFSREKKLDKAIRLYKDPSNDAVRDGHHACIVIDCCARCGRIEEGEKLIEEMKAGGQHVNVETKTAMIKGFAHSGQMAKADALFVSMCAERARVDRPNVRTMNTLLRGCLWSASSVDQDGYVTGGVVTAEKAWALCRQLHEKDPKSIMCDVSSYEYSIALLCQALRTDDAKVRIEEMKSFFEVSEVSSDIPQSVSEALALSQLALARAFAMHGDSGNAKSACDQFRLFAEASMETLAKGQSVQHGKDQRYAVKQGKESKGRRNESNLLYRNHRINEAEQEMRVIMDLCRSKGLAAAPRQLARRLVTRLLVVGGGGSTCAEKRTMTKDQDDIPSSSTSTQTQLLNTLYSSYGLKKTLDKMDVSGSDGTGFLRKRDCNRILGSIGLQGGIVGVDGILDVQRIFRVGLGDGKHEKKRSKRKGRLEIELGSGFGEWIVQKARREPTTDFLSVELRADRVGQTFAKMALLAGTTPVDNLCIVGAESRSFLSNHVKDESVSAIYINHPEPPTQTFGADSLNLDSIANGGPEPAHMITSQMLRSAAKCLSTSGDARLIIVTDNRWYGRVICATLVKVMTDKNSLLVPSTLQDHSYTAVETFPAGTAGHITLYEGQPNETIGHPQQEKLSGVGATYFDRLWRTGAGSHADKSSRFIVVVGRPSQ